MEKSGLGIRIVWDHNRDLMNHRQMLFLMILRRQNMLEWDFIGENWTGRAYVRECKKSKKHILLKN
jgi:hypothetical protein